MSVEAVREVLREHGLLEAYREFSTSSATVELAAQAVGCEPGRIAKTLSFKTRQGPVLVVVMGTARIDNRKFKDCFGEKAVFPKGEEVPELVGHPVGGCARSRSGRACGSFWMKASAPLIRSTPRPARPTMRWKSPWPILNA